VKSGGPSIEKGKEYDVESWHLQGCSPRLCRLRTDGLAPARKYWMYRSHAGVLCPVSLVAGYQQKLEFSPLLYWLLWERSWVWTHGSASRHVVDWVGSPSSRGKWICSNLLMTTWKVVIRRPCEIHIVEGHTRTKRGKCVACWSGFPLQGVHRFESPRLSDMSNSLSCSSHDIDNLIELLIIYIEIIKFALL
jgi:hypothetical protein